MLRILVLVMVVVATCDARSRHHSKSDAEGNQKLSSLGKYAIKYLKKPLKSMTKKDKKALYGFLMTKVKSALENLNKNNNDDTPDVQDSDGMEYREERSAPDCSYENGEDKNPVKREQPETPLRNQLDVQMENLEQTLEALLLEEGEDLDE